MNDIFLYDAHTWEGDRIFTVSTDSSSYRIVVVDELERKAGNAIVFIADELCGTRFPYFFPKVSRVALLKESPIYSNKLDVQDLQTKFDLVLTHNHKFLEFGEPFVRMDYSSNWVERDPNYTSFFVKNKLVSFIYNSLNTSIEKGYIFRTNVFNEIHTRNDVDIYGRGIHDIEFKTTGLNKYCFSIAMENYRSDYYFTEKLIDCILTETIPIYWGCPSIGELFDKRGILSFSNIDELNSILDKINCNLYDHMKPYVIANKKKCIELRLNDSTGYFGRIVDELESNTKIGLKHLGYFNTSKSIALLRYFRVKLDKLMV